MAFEPFTIPLTSGLRQDLAANAGIPQYLKDAQNIVFTHTSSVRGRPGMVVQDAIIQATNLSGSPAQQSSSLLSTNTTILTQAGIETINNQILAFWQGRAFARTSIAYNNAFPWRDIGPIWSTKKKSSPFLDYRITDKTIDGWVNPVAVGTNLVSIPVLSNNAISLVDTNASNLNLFDTSVLTNFDAVSAFHACIATDGIVDIIMYPKADGSLYCHVNNPTTIPGIGTEGLVGGPGTVGFGGSPTSQGQSVWIVAGQASGEFFAAFRNAIAGRIDILNIHVVGGVTSVAATLPLTGLGTINWGVCICHNGLPTGSGGKICLGFNDSTANLYKTKIINSVGTGGGGLVDNATNISYTTTAATWAPHTVGAISTTGIIISYLNNVSNLIIASAVFGGVVGTTILTLFAGNTKTWLPFIPAVSFCTKQVIGIQLLTAQANPGAHAFVASSQWYLVDLTSAGAGGSGVIVAAGKPVFCMPSPAINAVVFNKSYKFGTIEGILFDVGGIQSAGSVVNTLTTSPIKSATVKNISILSGQTPYQYDGNQVYPVNFVESIPAITAGIFTGAGSSIAGSYSFQAIWEEVTSNGQIMRSGQSNIVTQTSAGALKIIITVSVPQLVGRYLLPSTVRIKVYSTQANPSAGAPLYLSGVANLPITAGRPTAGTVAVTLFQTSDTDKTQEQLYTGSNILDDQAPYGADRGVAFVNNRLWTASSDKVFVSKLLQSNYSPAWNNSGVLVINTLSSIGEIVSIEPLIDKLVVFGTEGIGIIFGSGFDDLGNGAGYTFEPVSKVKFTRDISSSVRSSTSIPDIGVTFLGLDNDIYLINYSGQVKCIGRETKDTINTGINELSYCDCNINSQTEIHPLLISNGDPMKILDIETGQWCVWSTINTINVTNANTKYTSLNGVIFAQTDVGDAIYSFSDFIGQDTSTAAGSLNIAQSVITNNTSVMGPQESPVNLLWGRLRSVSIFGTTTTANSYILNVNVTSDPSNKVLLSKVTTILPTPSDIFTNWPFDSGPEFRATIQRCSTFNIQIVATPAIAEWTNIECWTSYGTDRAPSRNRN